MLRRSSCRLLFLLALCENQLAGVVQSVLLPSQNLRILGVSTSQATQNHFLVPFQNSKDIHGPIQSFQVQTSPKFLQSQPPQKCVRENFTLFPESERLKLDTSLPFSQWTLDTSLTLSPLTKPWSTPAHCPILPNLPGLCSTRWQPHSPPRVPPSFSTKSTPAQWAAERQEKKKRAETVKRRVAFWRQIAEAETEARATSASATSAGGSSGPHVPSSPVTGPPSFEGQQAVDPNSGNSGLPFTPGIDLLGRGDLMVTRRVEWANVLLGFEQENKYEIMDPRDGQVVGYILETSNWIMRQMLRRRRHFSAKILDANKNVLFEVERPFFFISSRMRVHRGVEELGEVRGRWHLWRRNYDLFARKKQFAEVENPGLWWWTFVLKDEEGRQLAVVDRNFRGLGYEAFTDAGQYLIRLGQPLKESTVTSHLSHATPTGISMQQAQAAAHQASQIPFLDVARTLNLDERAVSLAFAVSLDCDFFSRHSEGGGGWLPFLPFIMAGEG